MLGNKEITIDSWAFRLGCTATSKLIVLLYFILFLSNYTPSQFPGIALATVTVWMPSENPFWTKLKCKRERVFCLRLYIIFDCIRNFLFLFHDISILVGMEEIHLHFRFDFLLKSSDTTGQPRYFIKSFLNVSCERVNLLKSRIRKHL